MVRCGCGLLGLVGGWLGLFVRPRRRRDCKPNHPQPLPCAAAKVATALKLSEDDDNTIESLKKQIEKAWTMVEAYHEKELRANETIQRLKGEIANLTTILEKQTGITGRDNTLDELLKARAPPPRAPRTARPRTSNAIVGADTCASWSARPPRGGGTCCPMLARVCVRVPRASSRSPAYLPCHALWCVVACARTRALRSPSLHLHLPLTAGA
jgi:hypothetical protein